MKQGELVYFKSTGEPAVVLQIDGASDHAVGQGFVKISRPVVKNETEVAFVESVFNIFELETLQQQSERKLAEMILKTQFNIEAARIQQELKAKADLEALRAGAPAVEQLPN